LSHPSTPKSYMYTNDDNDHDETHGSGKKSGTVPLEILDLNVLEECIAKYW
jgi:hypothetical protein